MLGNGYVRRAVAGLLVISNLSSAVAVFCRGAVETFEQKLQARLVQALSGSKCDNGGIHDHVILVEKLIPFSESGRAIVSAQGIIGWLTPYRLEGASKLADSIFSIQTVGFDMARRYTIGLHWNSTLRGARW